MGLIDYIKNKIKSQEKQVYCQHCSKELTELGGTAYSGKIFCGRKNEKRPTDEVHCSYVAITKLMVEDELADPEAIINYKASDLQKAIRSKKVFEYGKLEAKVSSLSN